MKKARKLHNMQWVMRKGVKFDHSACAWLILRHLDPQATFGYLEADQMPAAIAESARPFHNIGYAGPGPRHRSSFEDLLAESKLDQSNAALKRMAELIHAAEIGAEATGADDPLRAIAKGVKALVKTDQEMVDRMLPIYDAHSLGPANISGLFRHFLPI